MKWATTVAAFEVAVTSLVLILSPVLFSSWILAAELSEAGQALGRLAGIALFGFALTSWPDPGAKPVARALLTYQLLATIYLFYLGIAGVSVGPLLWPAVVVHLLLAVLLAAARRSTELT
ncbi:hypothetical protein [Sinorhizobium fredii]|uniref:hypothetical protein n=1 Tax=Rhizobium fredii TaxID=380 RepID=UPI0033912C02